MNEPLTLKQFADSIGMSEHCVRRWCTLGYVIGARKHPLTKKWAIYPPAKLALNVMKGKHVRVLSGESQTFCTLPEHKAENVDFRKGNTIGPKRPVVIHKSIPPARKEPRHD